MIKRYHYSEINDRYGPSKMLLYEYESLAKYLPIFSIDKKNKEELC